MTAGAVGGREGVLAQRAQRGIQVAAQVQSNREVPRATTLILEETGVLNKVLGAADL